MENKYRGECAGCGQHVAAYAGVYDWGVLSCGTADISELDDWSRQVWRYWVDSIAPESCAGLFARFMREQMTPEVVAERAATRAAELAALDAMREAMRAELVDNGKLAALAVVARVRSLDAVIVKICGDGACLAALSWPDAVAVRNELESRVERRERAAFNKANGGADCRKCGGTGAFWQLGGGDKYVDNGCWRCHGTGKEPRRGS